MADVVLPLGKERGRPPLLLEPVGVALGARAAEIEDALSRMSLTYRRTSQWLWEL